MAIRTSIDGVIADAQKAIDVWNANPTLAVGELSKAGLTTLKGQIETETAAIETLRTQLAGMVDTRNDKIKTMTGQIKRVRATVKGVYGSDSAQYEQVGGVRDSERKPAARPSKTEPSK